MTTVRAGRCRYREVEFLDCLFCVFNFEEFSALLAPVTFQNNGQTIDDDIQKTANTKAEKNNGCIKQPLFMPEYVKYFQEVCSLLCDNFAHLEDG